MGLSIVYILGFLAGRNPHDLDGVADHVGGALLAAGASRHRTAILARQSRV